MWHAIMKRQGAAVMPGDRTCYSQAEPETADAVTCFVRSIEWFDDQQFFCIGDSCPIVFDNDRHLAGPCRVETNGDGSAVLDCIVDQVGDTTFQCER